MYFSKERFNDKVPAVTTAMSGRVRIAINEKAFAEEVVTSESYAEQPQMALKNIYEYDVAWIEPKDGESPLDCTKRLMKEEIAVYDKSSAVNEFSIGGHKMWYTHDRRSALGRAMQATKSSGISTFEFFDDSGWHIELPIDTAIEAADKLELYAMQCLIATNKHLAAIDKLTTIEEVFTYDYKTGYPGKLVF